jgi:hypothetical protein
MNVSRQAILEYGRHVRDLQAAEPDGIWQRVELLRKEDRLIVELALRGGASHRRIAELVGGTPGGISRRLSRLGRRLNDPRVLALLHPQCPLEGQVRQIGVERLLVDCSVAELAKKHALPAGRVRQVLGFIDLWHRGVVAARRIASTSAAGANGDGSIASSSILNSLLLSK